MKAYYSSACLTLLVMGTLALGGCAGGKQGAVDEQTVIVPKKPITVQTEQPANAKPAKAGAGQAALKATLEKRKAGGNPGGAATGK